jgi:methionyl aminopeptidase
VATCRPDTRLGDIGAAIQGLAEERGYGVVRDFVGHGIGQRMHEEPQVPNFGKAGTGRRLKPGMTIAIEPMLARPWRSRRLAHRVLGHAMG